MAKQLVFIASLIHSGSTLLDMIVGGHPRFIGLGEVNQVIKQGPMGLEKTRQVICSCGQQLEHCPFWGNVAEQLQRHHDRSVLEKYRMVLDIFEEVFGPTAVPVDSSKTLSHLGLLQEQLGRDIRVLYILRDVRSFTISHIDNAKRKGIRHWDDYVRATPLYAFWWWYRTNRQYQRVLSGQKMKVMQLGYEELCLSSQQILPMLCEFLGEKPDPAMLTLENSGSHIIRGNRMRYQKQKAELRYDHRWFSRTEWLAPAFFLPHIMRYNRHQVYKNETEAMWKQ